MTDKVQKIRKEVARLKSQLIKGACASQIAMETRCKEEAYNEVIAILDSLQEEPVSEDLEKTAEDYANKHSILLGFDCDAEPIQTGTDIEKAVIYGAQWQKKQMMKDFPHWEKSTLPNDDVNGFNSEYFCHEGYRINYKELFIKLPKDE